jgi:hypothetical protein
MASTQRITKVVGNPAGALRRAFGQVKSRYQSAGGGSRGSRRNPGHIVGLQLAGNPGGKKVRNMAKAKKVHHRRKTAGGYSRSSYKKNPASRTHRRRSTRKNPGMRTRRYKRNPGEFGSSGVGSLVTNAVFVVVGALGSKLGAQAVLGTNNVGLVGYAGNAAVGGVLWFITEKLMKNKSASAGVISGTLVQILLRVINDYTPFGSYVAQLGMGDYQMQSFVTPQVLVDPWNSARIRIPQGWGARGGQIPAGTAMPSVAAGPSASTAAKVPGVSGLYGKGGGYGGGLYAA